MNSNTKKISSVNIILASIFGVLTIVFVVIMATNKTFFNWAFARHQNIISWYLRPLSIIPFCYFAYKRNPLGISLTIFLLATSMFWFSAPDTVSEQVQGFLNMEKEYLTTNWTVNKILVSLLVPITMALLAMAFWKRSFKLGILMIVVIAVLKALWSVLEGGEAGQSVIVPAVVGLVICIVFIYYMINRINKTKKSK